MNITIGKPPYTFEGRLEIAIRDTILEMARESGAKTHEQLADYLGVKYSRYMRWVNGPLELGEDIKKVMRGDGETVEPSREKKLRLTGFTEYSLAKLIKTLRKQYKEENDSKLERIRDKVLRDGSTEEIRKLRKQIRAEETKRIAKIMNKKEDEQDDTDLEDSDPLW